MKLTYKGDYSLKAILDLAMHHGGDPVTINDMAKRIDAPVKFLEQILLDLKRGGFIESRRGKVGGYLLSKPPSSILVGDVIRYIDGPIEPISCVKEGYSQCADAYKCVFRSIWQDVYRATSIIVDSVNFEDLAFKAASSQSVNSYSI
ncbi:MAG TPA: Rrf2 family transcriptional regulator [Candidatus Omnitrophota bacterium]|nr:Rrf2 family transcriptional regulator [Candidatus Omnitrophota bacterium]